MEMSPGLTLPLIIILLICKMSWAVAEVPMGEDQHSTASQDLLNARIGDEEKRGVGTRDLVRRFLMALNNKYPYDVHHGRLGGIPFRPARRIGSEFLGKRSVGETIGSEMREDEDWEQSSPDKRARARMGSEFLGKRRLGSEFLGKRTPYININEMSNEEPDRDMMPLTSWNYQPTSDSSSLLPKSYEKRALGSEFLGKRRNGGGYDWTWKRARLGSEFLGKRALGSEFLGKRGQMDADLVDVPPM